MEKKKGNRDINMNKEIINHIEWFTILITIVGGFFLLSGRMDQQSARTDRLYEMFIEVVRDKK